MGLTRQSLMSPPLTKHLLQMKCLRKRSPPVRSRNRGLPDTKPPLRLISTWQQKFEDMKDFQRIARTKTTRKVKLTTMLRNTTKAPFGDNNITTTNPLNKRQTFKCPEEEMPSNLGPYEVPSQRDLIGMIRRKIKKMFKNYHQKALNFLMDIKKATRATVEVEKKCPGSRALYRQCVKHVSNQCELITKMLVTSLEIQRHNVTEFTKESICTLPAMKEDPVKLIKIMAMEEVSLDFALPGFLRLLNACSNYCISSRSSNKSKPARHMTDADLVIKHFLNQKSYLQLLRDTKNGTQ